MDLTNEQIAHNIGITRQTLNEWKKKFPSISDTLKRGKEVVDRQVENALLKRALGYKYDEITREPKYNEVIRPNGNDGHEASHKRSATRHDSTNLLVKESQA
jgi:hypothetical protein